MRPKKQRWVRCSPEERCFVPKSSNSSRDKTVILSLDEIEAIRLADFEEMEQSQVAQSMKIHRSTVSRILASGRKKLADAVVNIKTIKAEGGCCNFSKEEKR